ncbi:hypothetical protein [Clostridium perfringens]|uniref:hypothetical protein n=1 Tax=Clostridium perfringens TaxID=1502 RepID=UPI00016BD711|nr:hypothetical protein [Clostridium perfringens]EJT6492905.1 hypothetical protein [Clostridium perfringens]EJT6558220.1 hypothetical protein [Clostridium perfringens]MDK0866075.1 hypothetical protein [Clostridium perfringens]MDT7916427.1 hypothetical protein [Clostridium perfringens]MDT7936641.1 hypothetical protein [Clostridium perfringens]
MNTRKIEILKEIIEEQKALIEENKDHKEITEMLKSSLKVIEYTLENEYKNPTKPMVIIKKEPENMDLLKKSESDLKQLTNGQVFKSWKEVCSHFGWKETRGDYKKAKIKELDTLCKWHKEGNKIIIDEVYEKQLDKKDGRKNNFGTGKKSIYYKDFEIIMLKLFELNHTNYLDFTITQLMQMVGMVNKDYVKYKYSKGDLLDSLRTEESMIISNDEINNFYEVHQKLLSEGAKTCLKKLKQACLVDLKEIRMIRTFKLIVADEDGTTKREYIDREATKEELELILVEKRKLLEKIGCSDLQQIYQRRLQAEFYRELRTVLEEKYQISFDYTSYRAILNKSAISKELEELQQIVNIDELILSINGKAYKKSIEDYNPKVIDRIGAFEGFKDLKQTTKLLSDRLILS